MDMIGKVRRMRMREKLSISEIAKTTRLARNTIKKWLKEPGDVEPKYRRSSLPGKLTAYMATLEQCLKTDSHRPKHARRNGKVLINAIALSAECIRAFAKQFDAQPYRQSAGAGDLSEPQIFPARLRSPQLRAPFGPQ